MQKFLLDQKLKDYKYLIGLKAKQAVSEKKSIFTHVNYALKCNIFITNS